MKAVIVVPTIREILFAEFMAVWKDEFRDHHVIVVEDNPSKTFKVEGDNVTHYSHEDIDVSLMNDSWIIPRRNSCVRSYGIYKAWQMKPDMVVTLDDDCFPDSSSGPFLATHYSRLTNPNHQLAWLPVTKDVKTRGYPYYNTLRTVYCSISHGLWSGTADMDAATQLTSEIQEVTFSNVVVPKHMYFTMSSMNLAFKPEMAPMMYFLLMGKGYYDKFGDIWCGVFAKKICDHLGLYVHSGDPIVLHKRASNVFSNLRREAPYLEINEEVWEKIDGIPLLSGNTVKDCYLELADYIALWGGDYWHKLSKAMVIWAGLFK